jgi:hypothetical protein
MRDAFRTIPTPPPPIDPLSIPYDQPRRTPAQRRKPVTRTKPTVRKIMFRATDMDLGTISLIEARRPESMIRMLARARTLGFTDDQLRYMHHRNLGYEGLAHAVVAAEPGALHPVHSPDVDFALRLDYALRTCRVRRSTTHAVDEAMFYFPRRTGR